MGSAIVPMRVTTSRLREARARGPCLLEARVPRGRAQASPKGPDGSDLVRLPWPRQVDWAFEVLASGAQVMRVVLWPRTVMRDQQLLRLRSGRRTCGFRGGAVAAL